MKGKYQVAFIIPQNSLKVLGEDGWEFTSAARISEEIKDCLIQSLELVFLESYLGIDVYTHKNMKMSVINDNRGFIENISFQLYGDSLNALSDVCKDDKMSHEIELFVPAKCAENKQIE